MAVSCFFDVDDDHKMMKFDTARIGQNKAKKGKKERSNGIKNQSFVKGRP